ncbi:MAG: DUF456 family protein [Candidatus Aminicenantales bacterium]
MKEKAGGDIDGKTCGHIMSGIHPRRQTAAFLQLAGTKRFGSTKRGFWGALLRVIAGTILFPPFGLIIGVFLGAMIFRLFVAGLMTFFFILKVL